MREGERAGHWAWLAECGRDIQYAARQLRQTPAFAITAVLTLALGIGATTTIFTLVHAVLLKSLPVVRPSELIAVGSAKSSGAFSGMRGDWEVYSYDLYKYLRDHTDGFQSLAAFQSRPERIGVRRSGDAEAAQPMVAQFVSGNYFSTFGVSVFAGREIRAEDDRIGAAPVAIMAYRLWQERFGLDPSVIGATFNMNGIPVTVAGVAPPGFFGDALRPDLPDFWLPLADEPAVKRGNWINNAQLHWLYLIGRVKPGVDPRTIEAQMRTELHQWLLQWKGTLGPVDAAQIPMQTLHFEPGGGGMGVMRQTYSAGLELLMAVSGLVLMIVCANLANLMLVRGLGRVRQTSIRLALGAGRWRVIRQALTESVVLGLIGGAAGVALAYGGTRALLHAVFAGANSIPISATPDRAVLLFAFATSLLAGVIFGAAPAWSVNRTNPIDALGGSGRATHNAGFLAQRGLVIIQAALSLVLLVAAGLLIQSLRNLEHQQLGFARDQRVVVRIDPNLAGYKPDQLESVYRTIRERLARLPGVVSVSYALWAPMIGGNWMVDVAIDGQPPPTIDGQNLTAWNRVGPEYFDAIGTPILRGRPILESDTGEGQHVAVITEAFARRFFPGVDSIGKHFGPWDTAQPELARSFVVIGLAADAKYNQPSRPALPMFFVPRAQVTHYSDPGSASFEARSLYLQDIVAHFAGDAGGMERPIRQAFAEIDSNMPIIRIQSFDVATARQLSQETLIARLTSLFGLTALLLASIGLYGVTSYAVVRRTKEIGIRVALGANHGSILKMVLGNAYGLVGVGLAAGLPLALSMGRIVSARLYGTSWHNPAILFGAVAVLALSALIATIIPAFRAARVDPVQTLRSE
jgi:predicted permease